MKLECTICRSDFDIEAEGGQQGDIGILPVAFCPTCVTGILDFADQRRDIESLFMEETNVSDECTDNR